MSNQKNDDGEPVSLLNVSKSILHSAIPLEELEKMKTSPFVKNGTYTVEDLVDIHYLRLIHEQKMKKYWRWCCDICNTKLTTLENHKEHLTTDDHKENRQLKMNELCTMDLIEMRRKYDTTNIVKILKDEENFGLCM